jgi:excisionase family DNA binding protein
MTFLSRAEFARRLKVTRPTITQWARKGYIKFAADGRRILVEESERLLRQRLPKYRGGTAKGPAAGEEGDSSAEWTTPEAVRRKENALARLRQIEANTAEGKLIRVDDFKALWSSLIISNRNMYLGTPGQIYFEIPTLSPHDRSVIERIVRDNLQDASLGRGYFLGGSDGKENDRPKPEE